MSGSATGHDDHSVRKRLAAAAASSEQPPPLECVVVHYQDRPDRCTITPRECSETERLTTWLSADIGAVVDLDAVR
ncbi:DUF7511 domain-containing protein [Natronorubrum bangense]|uniref:DUF7511 domain-containing protein n=2 Tax=Natronorubrum bangense TaxID=61858 RepID=L9WJY6_9EURY|nr:hypothetical protein [Natronorubrum bangense]ELY48673.1 hypothetical protein C494_10210 [Natronorubrum bangense JCM 10635]QCC53930.1 hypothetical protein DV706_05145 [Natronorubrum bangense]